MLCKLRTSANTDGMLTSFNLLFFFFSSSLGLFSDGDGLESLFSSDVKEEDDPSKLPLTTLLSSSVSVSSSSSLVVPKSMSDVMATLSKEVFPGANGESLSISGDFSSESASSGLSLRVSPRAFITSSMKDGPRSRVVCEGESGTGHVRYNNLTQGLCLDRGNHDSVLVHTTERKP